MTTELQDDFRIHNLKLWEEKLREIFHGFIPKHCVYDNILQINKILNIIGVNNLNHMLYPDGGGLDIAGCSISLLRSDCIEIMTGIPNLCKPKQLIFDCIDNNMEWSYFRLELDRLEPSIYDDGENKFVERLYENNGSFEPYTEYPPNENSRLILKIIEGTLLIIPKASYYNHIPDTYLGIHNNYSYSEFRLEMERLKKAKSI